MAEPDAAASDSEREVAARARNKAKAAGAVGPARMLERAQKSLRDAAIVVSINAGIPTKDVAKDFGITPRSVLRIMDDFRERRTAIEQAPMEIVEGAIRAYDSQIVRFARIAEVSLERQPAVALAAVRMERETEEKRNQLLAAIGKLPTNLELFRSEATLRGLVDALLDRLDAEAETGDERMVNLRQFLWDLVDAPVAGDAIEGRELGPGQ